MVYEMNLKCYSFVEDTSFEDFYEIKFANFNTKPLIKMTDNFMRPSYVYKPEFDSEKLMLSFVYFVQTDQSQTLFPRIESGGAVPST